MSDDMMRNKMPPAMALGQSFAEQLIPMIKAAEISTENDVILWWAGFLGGISGMAAASIGGDAVRVLGKAFEPTIKELIDEHTH